MPNAPLAHKRPDWWVAGFGLLALLAWDVSGLDLALMRLAGTADGFPLRNHWVTSGLLHEGGRILAWGVLLLLAVNVWRPLVAGPTRPQRGQWLLLTVLCLVAVPALKQASATSCPWDLAEFGGTSVHVSHWRFGVSDGGPGRCFPSGHAASAFGFLWGYFALRTCRPRAARVWLTAVLAFGALFGMAQFLRGAHYASHTLWTAWFCWAICVAAQAALGQRTNTARAVPTATGPHLPRPVGEDAT